MADSIRQVERSPTSRLKILAAAHLPWVLSAAFSIAAVCALFWPVPRWPSHLHAPTAFGESQIWCFDHLFKMVTGQRPLSTETWYSGYPYVVDARFIAWLPALLAAPFRLVMGPTGAYNVVMLATPGLAAVAAYLFLRRATDAGRWWVSIAAAGYALSPYLLSTLANGQIEKAQLWSYPLYLTLLWTSVRGPHRRWSLLGLWFAMVAITFTGPYFALYIPLIAAPLALGLVLSAGSGSGASALGAVLALGLTALPPLAARAYYAVDGGGAALSMFRTSGPPQRLEGRLELFPPPAAQPESVLLGPIPQPREHLRADHVTYLPPLLLIGAALGLLFGRRGRWVGAALLLMGVVLALGPRLLMNNTYQTFGGGPAYLPVELLERLGYPTARAGQYYRAIPIASLGIAALMASAAGRARAIWALPVMFLLTLGGVWMGVQRMPHLLPREAILIPAEALLKQMAHEPGEGAILALPMFTDESSNGTQLMIGAEAGRPTSAMARHVRLNEVGKSLEWLTAWARLEKTPEGVRGFLSALGFRYVVLLLDARSEAGNAELGFTESDMVGWLGPGQVDGRLHIWDMGPTELTPLRLPPPPARPAPPGRGL